jgi:S1-C subfamily serine protease
MVTLTPLIAQRINEDTNARIPEIKGVLVMRVLPESPAAKAGLREGDVITQVNAKPISTAEQLQDMIEATPSGQKLRLRVRRVGQDLDLSVLPMEMREALQ